MIIIKYHLFLTNIIEQSTIKDTINIYLVDDRIEDPPYIIHNSSYEFIKTDNHWVYSAKCCINVYILKYNICNYEIEKKYISKIYNTIKEGIFIINDYSGLENG